MSLFAGLKSFWPLLFTFLLPKALGYFNTLKTAYRTRPPPRPLPPKANVCLNILFCSVLFFFIQSFPQGPDRDVRNVFSTTGTRLGVPTEMLFARLSMLRPNGILTPKDEALRDMLGTKESRLLYLTYGPSSLLNCPFCHHSQPTTYAMYHLPSTILLPHLLHLTILGLATSAALAGSLVSSFRSRTILPALALLVLDVSLAAMPPSSNPLIPFINLQVPGPWSLYSLFKTLRPLSFCILDALLALYLWTTVTNRFFLIPFLSSPTSNAAVDIPALQQVGQELVGRSTMTSQMSQQKLRAYAIARNTVLRDEGLRVVEESYWREVKRQERLGLGGSSNEEEVVIADEDEIWQDEEVQAAIATVYGSGRVDIPRARREAAAFVDGVTKGLDED